MKVWELLEDVDGDQGPVYNEVSLERVKKLIFHHCKDARWMFVEDKPIWRGERKHRLETGFALVDTTKTRRKSQNTSNHYTVLFDHLNSWKDWPKRSQSFIGSTSQQRAGAFGQGNLFAIIPFDGVPIGYANQHDLWETDVRMFGGKEAISTWNDFFFHLGIKDNWEDFIRFDRESKDEEAEEMIVHRAANWGFDQSALKRDLEKGFLNTLEAAYSPEVLGYEKHTTQSIKSKMNQNSEVWVSGSCILISTYMWLEHRKDLAP